jgi:hypothetical protein
MLVCADYQPFSMSDSVAFRNFVRALNQSWTPPSRTAVSECLVPALAKEIEERLIDLLKKIDDISLTTDAWTSKATENFEALTGHFIDEDFKFKSVTIGIEQLLDQTAAGHAQLIRNLLAKHEGLLEKVRSLTSDNASVMKLTAKLLNLEWFGCFPHTVNLVVKDGLKISQCVALLSSIRTTVSYFKRSSKAMARLHDVQRQLNLPLHRLIRDCETRWSSTYDMIARYIEQFPAIQLVCSEEAFLHPTLSAVDLQELKKLRDLLKPFAEITTLMSSETNVTASSVRFLLILIVFTR